MQLSKPMIGTDALSTTSHSHQNQILRPPLQDPSKLRINSRKWLKNRKDGTAQTKKSRQNCHPVGSKKRRNAVEVKFQYETDETCTEILRCYLAFAAATLPTLPSHTESWCLRNKWHWFAVGTSKVRSLADALSHSERMHLIIFMSN